MRKFTESLLFGVLFLFAAASWWIMDLTGWIPVLNPKELAPMTVGIVVIIATPALLVVTILAFVRALTGTNPKSFWAWVSAGSALVAGTLALGRVITKMEGLQLGFSNGVWFSAIFALLAFTGLILALTGAIPTPVKLTPEEKKAAKKAQKREKVEAKKAAKAEEKEQAQVQRALAQQEKAQQAAQAQAAAQQDQTVLTEEEVGEPSGFAGDLSDEDEPGGAALEGAVEELDFETDVVRDAQAVETGDSLDELPTPEGALEEWRSDDGTSKK